VVQAPLLLALEGVTVLTVFFPLLLLSVAAAVVRAVTSRQLGLAAAQVVAVHLGGFKVVNQPMVVREHQVKVLVVVMENQRLVVAVVRMKKATPTESVKVVMA
jgi:hypothetical protein